MLLTPQRCTRTGNKWWNLKICSFQILKNLQSAIFWNCNKRQFLVFNLLTWLVYNGNMGICSFFNNHELRFFDFSHFASKIFLYFQISEFCVLKSKGPGDSRTWVISCHLYLALCLSKTIKWWFFLMVQTFTGIWSINLRHRYHLFLNVTKFKVEMHNYFENKKN